MAAVNKTGMIHETEEIVTRAIISDEKLSLLISELHEEHENDLLSVHAQLLLFLIIFMAIVQVILLQWEKIFMKSFQAISSFAVWVMPIIICIYLSYWRFIIFWALFSLISGFVFRKSLEKPLHDSTPRLVYKWFHIVYKLSYILGIIGYIITIIALTEISELSWINYGFTIIYYGMYFGVLGQYCADICVSKMASQLGYNICHGLPTKKVDRNTCGICGNKLIVNTGNEGVVKSTTQLTCNHVFHDYCLRGWCIVGIRQTCPYCKEKINIEKIFPGMWQKSYMGSIQLLGWLRNLIVWGPIITMVLYVLYIISI